ncbi:uncharacterized protein J3R85_009679 [Psidium guajava]|nr:uncharacterized protein J3R85_009679 [Psidium guajava]
MLCRAFVFHSLESFFFWFYCLRQLNLESMFVFVLDPTL